jgi:hypothetical protein
VQDLVAVLEEPVAYHEAYLDGKGIPAEGMAGIRLVVGSIEVAEHD